MSSSNAVKQRLAASSWSSFYEFNDECHDNTNDDDDDEASMVSKLLSK